MSSLFENLRLVSLGDSLGFGYDSLEDRGGILEGSENPFAEQLVKKAGDDILDVQLSVSNGFPISDDTISTHLTLLALYQVLKKQEERRSPNQFALEFGKKLLHRFIEIQNGDTIPRVWGGMMIKLWEKFPTDQENSIIDVAQSIPEIIPFDSRGGGNGGAMHAVPIGILFHQLNDSRQKEFLVATAVESGRITHNCPSGFLGSVLVAFFTSCALNSKPVEEWPIEFLEEIIPSVQHYLVSSGTYIQEYKEGFEFFESKWRGFIDELQLGKDAKFDLEKFPATGEAAHSVIKKFAFQYSEEKDAEYWSGSSGHDVAMYAIYGLLTCQGNYRAFIDVVCNHPGDSDTTGAVGVPLYGMVYGTQSIPSNHLNFLERNDMLNELAGVAWPLFQKVQAGDF